MTQLRDEKMKYGCFDKIWGFPTVKVHVLSPGVWQFFQPVRLLSVISQIATWIAYSLLYFNNWEYIAVVMSYMCRIRNWGS
jgi:hypothetical protein